MNDYISKPKELPLPLLCYICIDRSLFSHPPLHWHHPLQVPTYCCLVLPTAWQPILIAAHSHCCSLHPSNCLFHWQHILDPHPPMLVLQSTILLVQNNFVDFHQQHHVLNCPLLVFQDHNNAPLDQFMESLGWLFNSKCMHDVLMPDILKALPYYCLLIGLMSHLSP